MPTRALAGPLAAILAVLAFAAGAAAQPQPAPGFGFQEVQVEAIKLSGSPFRPPADALPPALAELGYDDYRKIRFRADAGLWHGQGLLFDVAPFHLGFSYTMPVRINIVEEGTASPVPFDPSMFDYTDAPFDGAALAGDLGFAGFRLLFPLNLMQPFDEFMVFAGASYFRIVGRGQQYGLSARGLAIHAGEKEEEEFPIFREFWIEKPEPGAAEIVVHALLDSESVTGAYRFQIRPGTESPVEVRLTLFPRKEIAKLGVAPMSSMFLQGENQPAQVDDYRPEIHDSDGLLMRTGGGEWIWRPLHNPQSTRVSSFSDLNPRGFGLLQRDRAFAAYQDLEARYHTRPSLWVEPIGDWGEGVVQLVEIPTATEIHDNIAAYWVPRLHIERGQRLEWAYRLHSFLQSPKRPPLARVVATRSAPGATEEGRRFFVDFDGPALRLLDAGQEVTADVTANEGRIENVVVQKNEATDGWRVFFDYVPDAGKPADLGCALALFGEPLTETWVYPWAP